MYFVLCVILFSFFLLVLKVFLAQNKAIKLLKDGNLPIQRLHPIWYLIIKSLLPKNQNFDPRIKAFQEATFTSRLYNKERIFSASMAGAYYVEIFKPEFVEIIMNSYTHINKGWMYKYTEQWLGNGLITSSGESWRKKRKLLTPAFHFKILENFPAMINKHSKVLIEKLKKSQDPWVDTLPLMSLCTLDIIAETAMGVEIRAQENEESEYVKAIGKIEELLNNRMMTPWLWPDILFYISPSGREFRKVLNTIQSFIREVIQQKKKEVKENLDNGMDEEDNENIYTESKKKKAFLTLLLHHHFKNSNITEDEISDEVNTFMFAGHDTTAVSISWSLYILGLYPEIQQKLYEEIQSIFGEDQERVVDLNDLKQMKYLECVLKESLRVYPPVPTILRTNYEDFKLNDRITIPAGSSINIDIYSIHRDPELYPNPEIFDPDRFLPENSIGRHPYAFIPFSAGPRNCIGQRFALMEEKIVITNILRHFLVKSLDPRDKIMECGEIILRPKNSLRMQFILRSE